MQLGMIGLGRMGRNMVRRLLKGGQQCVVYNRSANAVTELVEWSRNAELARLRAENARLSNELATANALRTVERTYQ